MRKPGTPLRVLLIEGSTNDAPLLLRELERGGYEPLHERIDTPEEMERALVDASARGEPWEVIISDYCMPRFRAPDALALLRRLGYDTPFIVVSGKVGEELTVEAMRSGARDYITKDNLARLCPAVERELKEATVRRERERAEEELRRSEGRVRGLLQQAADAMFVHDLDGKFVDVNRRACESLGYTREELLGMSVPDVEMDYAPGSLTKLWAKIASGTPRTLEGTHRRKDGTTFPVEGRVGVFESEGRPLMLVLARDATERKRTEEELTRLASFPRLNPNPIVEMNVAGEVTYLNPTAERCFPDLPTLGRRHPMLADLDSVDREIRELGGQAVMREVRVDEAFYQQLIYPVPEGALLRFYALDVTERRRAEEALRESEERFRSLVQNASDIIMILEADGTIRYESPAVERVLGFKPEERIGTNAFDYLHPDDVGPIKSRFDESLDRTGDQLSVEYRVRDKEGSWRHLEAIGNNLLHAPIVRGLVVNSRDITERKRAEEELQRNESGLRTAQRIAHLGNWEYVLNEDRAQWSDELYRIFGFTPQEFVPTYKMFFDFVHPDDRKSLRKEIRRALRGEGKSNIDYRIVRSDDEVRSVHTQYEVVRDASGRATKMVGTVQDTTERRQAEEALRQSEELYRTVVEQAAENIFLVDVETECILEANAALHRSLGYTAEELKGMTLYDIVAHDRESIDRNIRRILEEGSLFLGERTYRHKDGSPVDVEVSASAISHGGREALSIVAHDVTERKQAEEDLRQSLSVLLALREAGQVLGSTLESEEIVSRLLEIMRQVSNLTAAVISMQDEDGRVRIWRSVGLEGLWRRARYAPEAEAARRAALETEEQRLFLLQRPDSETEYLAGLGLPLRTRDGIVGVLEAYGPESLAESDMVEILGSLASQAASALENARLYGELGEREHKLQDLVGKLLGAQEEERRRVAYEVHDGLAQVAAAAHQHLQAFAQRHPPSVEKGRRDLERVLRLVRRTVSEARRIIANLRPMTLDDLGLAATISLEVECIREDGYRVDYEEELGDERLPATVEIALFRVAQETLTNMRKHAQTRRVRIELRRRGEEVYLEVRDYGRGFDPTAVSSIRSGPGERVGLAGMRERVSILGGELELHSRPGAGTSVIVVVPLPTTVEEG